MSPEQEAAQNAVDEVSQAGTYDPAPPAPNDPEPNVLSGEEVDKLVERVVGLESENASLRNTIEAMQAEATETRKDYERCLLLLGEKTLALENANDPVHGIKHPDKIESLPKLDDLKPHPQL